MKKALVFVVVVVAHWPYAAVHADTFGSGANTFTIEFITIDNPGNAADATGNPIPAGAVGYTYRIGKYEISEEMIDKANELGQLSIGRDDIRGPNKPATSVSWNDAARFVNWLNTNSGGIAPYKFAVQPGEAGYVVDADIEPWSISDAGYNANNPYRNTLARYYLPSIDEWYKAAYFDPNSGNYFNYPTGSDEVPIPIAIGTAAGTAVYNGQSGPADITLAGGLSPFGTMAQGGNVYEWQETDFDLVNGPASSDRAVRGGAWRTFGGFSLGLSSSDRDLIYPSYEGGVIGFRVASVIPETNTFLLGTLAYLGMVAFRRR